MPRYARLLLTALFIVALVSKAFASLDLEVTRGVEGAVPIAILPFDQNRGSHLTNVMRSDFTNSGRFQVWQGQLQKDIPHQGDGVDWNYWQQQNQDYVVLGSINTVDNDRLSVHYELWDVYNQNMVSQATLKGPASKPRRLAHRLSDRVYEKITGIKGIFSTHIAYIKHNQKTNGDQERQSFKLMVADFDGHNPQQIFESEEPVMSPAWSPDGKKLAYVSYETGQSAIYVQNIHNGKRKKLASFPGINSAPDWSPDGNKLAMVLSKSGQPNIYVLDFKAFQLQRLTDEWAIDTEPEWSNDGQWLYFTSNRGGSPQIYKLNTDNQAVKRVTFDGRFNSSPSLSPNGRYMAYLHRADGQYNVWLKDLKEDHELQLTEGKDVQSPSIAPNGQMVVYSTRHGDQGVLGIVSTDAKIKMRLPSQSGNVTDPAWSPIVD